MRRSGFEPTQCFLVVGVRTDGHEAQRGHQGREGGMSSWALVVVVDLYVHMVLLKHLGLVGSVSFGCLVSALLQFL